jgi:hypothetical protein
LARRLRDERGAAAPAKIDTWLEQTITQRVGLRTGATTIECVKGCSLSWIARGLNPNSSPMAKFSFSCSDPSGCSSSRVGGWLVP